jgi:hypothetical protein
MQELRNLYAVLARQPEGKAEGISAGGRIILKWI